MSTYPHIIKAQGVFTPWNRHALHWAESQYSWMLCGTLTCQRNAWKTFRFRYSEMWAACCKRPSLWVVLSHRGVTWDRMPKKTTLTSKLMGVSHTLELQLPLEAILICNKLVEEEKKFGGATGKGRKKGEEGGRRGALVVSTLPEETGKDRKIIWEGCLIWWEEGGRAGGRERAAATAGFSTAGARGRLNQIN